MDNTVDDRAEGQSLRIKLQKRISFSVQQESKGDQNVTHNILSTASHPNTSNYVRTPGRQRTF